MQSGLDISLMFVQRPTGSTEIVQSAECFDEAARIT